jgi:hypothetical protein
MLGLTAVRIGRVRCARRPRLTSEDGDSELPPVHGVAAPLIGIHRDSFLGCASLHISRPQADAIGRGVGRHRSVAAGPEHPRCLDSAFDPNGSEHPERA